MYIIKNNKVLYILVAILIAMLIITIISCLMYPIYTDEIAIRIHLSRLIFDYPTKSGSIPICTKSYTDFHVLFLLPAFIEWLIHGSYSSLILLRIIGVLIAILFIYLLSTKLFETFKNEENPISNINFKLICILFVASIMTLGVLPIFIIINRNEQIIYISIFLMLLQAHGLINNKLIKKNIFLNFIGFYILLSMILYSHPKGFYLLPFLLILYYEIIYKSLNFLFKIILSTLILLQVVYSYQAFVVFWNCPEITNIAEFINKQNINPMLIFKSFNEFIYLLSDSIINFEKYIKYLLFMNKYEAGYLPEINSKKILIILFNCFYVAFILFIFIYPLILFKYFIKEIYHINKNKYITFNLLLIILYICIIVSMTLRIEKHWYDAGYAYTLLCLVYFFSLIENKVTYKYFINFKFLSLIFFLSILSLCIFNISFMEKFIKGYSGPGVSVTKLLLSNDDSEITRLINLCSINNNNKAFHLIIDDNTYNYFFKTQLPLPITYIWISGDAEKSRKFIANSNSTGMVLSCSSLNTYIPELYNDAFKVGKYCCVTHDKLLELNSFKCIDNKSECNKFK